MAPSPVLGRRSVGGAELLLFALVALALAQPHVAGLFDHPRLQTWSTIFVSITVQALPFLTLGVLLSGAIAAFVPPSAIERALPREPAAAVPVAGVAGLALPGCECGSVPVAGRLVSRGANPAPALTFLLAAPAINPIVLVSTAVAFPGQPEVVAARFAASLLTALFVGWIWTVVGRDEWVARARRRHHSGGSKVEVFRASAVHDLLHAGGWLVVGAMAAASLQTLVPRTILDTVADNGWLAILALATLAVVLSICSEADAFVAASLSQFSMTSRLVFLVVGPAVDIKLIALQIGTFGQAFALRFAPLSFLVSVGFASALGFMFL